MLNFGGVVHDHNLYIYIWHILGDRLIPEQPLWVEFSGILHVGPTKSLTALVPGFP